MFNDITSDYGSTPHVQCCASLIKGLVLTFDLLQQPTSWSPPPTRHRLLPLPIPPVDFYSHSRSHDQSHIHIMCYQIVERYAVCKCLYHRHAVDPCNNYGRPGHEVTEKTVLVGFACPDHGRRQGARTSKATASISSGFSSDSGYVSESRGRR